jgi:FtsP/CotA-like multicopper oxidase with cupredoxin domain
MQTKTVVVLLGVIILGGLFLLLRPSPSVNPEVSAAATNTSAMAAKVFDIVVKSRKVVSGSSTIQVTQGDQVTIRITADESDELHLHGYDKHVDFATDTPAELTFAASLSGRFPYEMEGSKTEIGTLEVAPK